MTINDLCKGRKELNFVFGKDESLVEDIIINFVLYKDGRAVAGIEIIDEKD